MADIPHGASLIDNPVSKAPGFQLGNVFALPGVPAIMRAMFDGIREHLRGGTPMLSRSIAAFTTEGAVAAALGRIQDDHARVEIGSYPFVRAGRFGVSLVIRATERQALDAAAEAVKALIREVGEEPIEDDAVRAATAASALSFRVLQPALKRIFHRPQPVTVLPAQHGPGELVKPRSLRWVTKRSFVETNQRLCRSGRSEE